MTDPNELEGQTTPKTQPNQNETSIDSNTKVADTQALPAFAKSETKPQSENELRDALASTKPVQPPPNGFQQRRKSLPLWHPQRIVNINTCLNDRQWTRQSYHREIDIDALKLCDGVKQWNLNVSSDRFMPLISDMPYKLSSEYRNEPGKSLTPLERMVMFNRTFDWAHTTRSNNRSANINGLPYEQDLNWLQSRMAVEPKCFAVDGCIYPMMEGSDKRYKHVGCQPISVYDFHNSFDKSLPVYNGELKINGQQIPVDPLALMDKTSATAIINILCALCKQLIRRWKGDDKYVVPMDDILNPYIMKNVIVIFKLPEYLVWFQFMPVYVIKLNWKGKSRALLFEWSRKNEFALKVMCERLIEIESADVVRKPLELPVNRRQAQPAPVSREAYPTPPMSQSDQDATQDGAVGDKFQIGQNGQLFKTPLSPHPENPPTWGPSVEMGARQYVYEAQRRGIDDLSVKLSDLRKMSPKERDMLIQLGNNS